MLLELWTEDYPLVFDGLVLEAFSSHGYRWHVTQIESIGIERGKRDVPLLRIRAGRYGGISGQVLPEASLPVLEQLVEAVDAVRAERYGWPPLPRG